MKQRFFLPLIFVGAIAFAAPKPQLEAPATGAHDSTGAQVSQAGLLTGKGAYASGGIGFGEGGGKHADLGVAFSLAGGYNFTPALGLEAGFTRLPTRSNAKKDSSSYIWDVAGVLTAPLQQRLRMFGKAGFAFVDNAVQVSDSTGSKGVQFAALLGGGVSYLFNPVLTFDGQGIVTIGDGQAANTWGLLFGATYHFTG